MVMNTDHTTTIHKIIHNNKCKTEETKSSTNTWDAIEKEKKSEEEKRKLTQMK